MSYWSPLETPEGKYAVRVSTWTRGNSRRVDLLLRNVSSRTVELAKGTRVARLSPANKIPPMLAPKREVIEITKEKECTLECENLIAFSGQTLEQTKDSPKAADSDQSSLTDEQRVEKLFAKLDLSGCESWTEDQKSEAKN